MSIIPFARETYHRLRASTPEVTLLNFIVEGDDSSSVASDPRSQAKPLMLLQRPGLDEYQTLGGDPIQGMIAANNPVFADAFAVAGNKLYSFNADGTTLLGSIGGSTGRVQMALDFDRLAIVSYPLLYVYGPTKDSDTPTLRNVAIPQNYGPESAAAVSVTMLNGYFIIAMEDGTFFWLEPGQDEFDPDPAEQDALQYASAESSPDGLVGVTTLNGNLAFLGSNTVEFWQPRGEADAPFERVSGQNYARGAVHRDTILNLDNSLFWCGEDGKVYRASNTPKRISTDGIDERLKLRTGDPHAWTFAHDAHLFYCLTIPSQGTFAYDVATETWSEFSSDGYDGWRPHVGIQTGRDWLCGDRETGNIWRVSDSATDAGEPMVRRASATVPIRGAPQRVSSLLIDMGCDAACEVRVRWADGDQQLEEQDWAALHAEYAGGHSLKLPRIDAARTPFRTFEVEVTDPCVVRLSQARVAEGWR